MANILTSESFLTVGVVLVSSGIGVLARAVSHNKTHKNRILSELAIGMDLLVTSMVLLVTRSITHFTTFNRAGVDESTRQGLNDHLIARMGMMLILMLMILFTAMLIRWAGWKKKGVLKPLEGIVVPLFLGVFCVWYVSQYF